MSRLRERRSADINLRSEPQMREYRAIAARVAADCPSLNLLATNLELVAIAR